MERIKPNKNLKKLTLLYVEDEQEIREPFELMIGRYFKNIYVGSNGVEGLELFKKHNDIDIVISDIKMPMMTGLEMAKEIKNINNDVIVIFTTAFGDEEYLKEAINLGADGYIIKPIDRNKVFSKLNSISHWIVAKKEAEQYVQLIKILFDYQPNALVLFDNDFNIILSNHSFDEICKRMGIENPKNILDLTTMCKDEKSEKVITKECFIFDKNKKNVIVCDNQKEKRFYDIEMRKVHGYLLMNIDDVTQYKMETEVIKDNSMKDELTKLYNRKKLEIELKRMGQKDICVIIFDIDNFKKINDTYGHLIGDEVLKNLAKIVQKNLRENDLVIRWGGEEFVVVLQNIKDKETAIKLAEKLRIAINQANMEKVGYISCSFGVNCGISNNFDEILELADEALYKAKKNGKNRVESF